MTACDPLTREECCDGTACPACIDGKYSEGWYYVADLMERRQWRWPDGTYTAPPLSPTEQATADRFEAAPDPWEEG